MGERDFALVDVLEMAQCDPLESNQGILHSGWL